MDLGELQATITIDRTELDAALADLRVSERIRRAFLIGTLLGILLATVTWTTVTSFDRLNQRVSFVEGYIGQLDHALRSR